MIRLHGNAPYKIFLVHGGPGAIGSLKGFADELSKLSERGIAEPIQSKYFIEELIQELYFQIKDTCDDKVSLIGHSWGALFIAFFAAKYPELIERIILVGCPPLEDKYVSEIGNRRMQNLSNEYAAIFQRLINNEATDEDMKKLPLMFEKSDNYCLTDNELHKADRTDNEMHNSVWNEAAKLRTNGEILTAFKNIKSKIYLIQGEMDPHTANGVIEPLQKVGVLCKTYILEKCGHSPYMEKYAKEEFYRILLEII